MTREALLEAEQSYLLPVYNRFSPCLTQGKGSTAQDTEGKIYLDFTSGIGVNSLGWCDPKWVHAVSEQAGMLQHTSNLFHTYPAAQLASSLCQKTKMAKAFFCNSGAEANEAAIKAARKYSFLKYGSGRSVILALENSFHGRTMATITATGQADFHKYFDPFLPDIRIISAGDSNVLQEALTDDVCAILFEPIQGESGVNVLQNTYLQTLEKQCRQKDILLIADEVQCGVGRTGCFLACEYSGILPNLVTLAKGLGGGLPIGALLLDSQCSHALSAGDHGSTFGGNPVTAAGANVVLDRLTPDFLDEVKRKGDFLLEKLNSLPGIQSITGRGLMLGIQFEPPVTAAQVRISLEENGLLCLLAKNKLRLLPPLVITYEEIEKGIAIIEKTLSKMYQ